MRVRLLRVLALALLPCVGAAQSTINDSNRYAYGANIGWVDWRANTNDGAVMGHSFCTGYVYGANVGWIHLGDGPTNNCAYDNASAEDYGVNIVSGRYLRGFAYGANIGWVNFESNGNPQIDLLSGDFSGFAYGANIGWISLSNSQAHVQTDSLDPGPDSDTDSVPDAWEYKYATSLTTILGGTNDTDGDGISDEDEYGADTDPTDPGEGLRITAISPSNSPGVIVTWSPTKPTRLYSVDEASKMSNGTMFADSGLGVFLPDPSNSTSRAFSTAGITTRFFRAAAHVPLTP